MRFLVFVSLLVFATAKAESPSAKGVVFEISKAGWADGGGAYSVGKAISIRSVFRNSASQPVTLSLKDHDQYDGTLPYPLDIEARIVSVDGKVLTANGTNKEGWWSAVYLSSSISSREPGDMITIPPGDKVTRIVPLHEILQGCDGLPRGLPAGHYFVQFRLGGLGLSVESNRLQIEVAAK